MLNVSGLIRILVFLRYKCLTPSTMFSESTVSFPGETGNAPQCPKCTNNRANRVSIASCCYSLVGLWWFCTGGFKGLGALNGFTVCLLCFCTSTRVLSPELPAVHPQCAHSEWAEVPLHSAHLSGCGGGEDLSCGQVSGRPEGAVPGSALPHWGLQSVSSVYYM